MATRGPKSGSGGETPASRPIINRDALTAVAVTTSDVAAHPDPVWKLKWLTPFRCQVILGLALVLGFFSQLVYLTRDCPIDLSGDEAQYWDWSRNLDLSYYSK